MRNDFTEGIREVRETKAYSGEKGVIGRISMKSLLMNKSLMNPKKFMILTNNMNSAFFMSIIALIIFIGGYKVATGSLSIGGLTAIMMYNSLLIDPMVNFFSFYQELQKISVSCERIFSIPDEDSENDSGMNKDFEFRKELRVGSVNFIYDNRYVLKNINPTARRFCSRATAEVAKVQ